MTNTASRTTLAIDRVGKTRVLADGDILRDGETIRAPIMIMDSASPPLPHEVAEAEIARRAAEAAEGARDAAHAIYVERLNNAHKSPAARSKENKPLDGSYEAMVEQIGNAWKGEKA